MILPKKKTYVKARIMMMVLMLSSMYYLHSNYQWFNDPRDLLSNVLSGDVKNLPSSTQSATLPSASLKEPISNEAISKEPLAEEIKMPLPITEMAGALKSFRHAHGYFNADELSNYVGYSDQTLKDLMKGGDMKAVYILADRILKITKGPDYRKNYIDLLNIAAAQGSTWALTQMTALSVPGDKLNDATTQRKALIEHLAIYRTAELRGDILHARDMALFDTRYFEKHFGPLALTEVEKSIIKAKGRLRYERLVEQRAKLGFPPFDNSIPEAVKYHFQQKYKD